MQGREVIFEIRRVGMVAKATGLTEFLNQAE